MAADRDSLPRQDECAGDRVSQKAIDAMMDAAARPVHDDGHASCYYAGRCEARIKDGDWRCSFRATWSVLTTDAELLLCGVHVRAARNWPNTLAVEPLDG